MQKGNLSQCKAKDIFFWIAIKHAFPISYFDPEGGRKEPTDAATSKGERGAGKMYEKTVWQLLPLRC